MNSSTRLLLVFSIGAVAGIATADPYRAFSLIAIPGLAVAGWLFGRSSTSVRSPLSPATDESAPRQTDPCCRIVAESRMWFFVTDGAGEILFRNPAVMTSTEEAGIDPPQHIAELVLADDRRMIERIVSSLRPKQPRAILELAHPFIEGAWLNWSFEGKYDETGAICEVVIQGQDASETRRAREKLRKSEKYLKAIFDTEPECVKTVSKDGILLDMNPAGLRYVEADSLDSVRGSSVYALVTPEHRDRFIDLNRRVFAGESASLEFEIEGLRGTRRWMSTHAVPFRDDQGQVTAHLAVTHDVSERRKMREELVRAKDAAEQAARAKDAFLANMSHEIRTPMTAILGFAETLLEVVPNPEARPAIETIQRNGSHLLRIINDILDLSKIEANQMRLELIPCSPRQVFEQAIELLRHRAEMKGLELHLEFRGEIPEMLETDPTRLRQILINLVGNAIKFSPEGRIDVVLAAEPDGEGMTLRFEVRDNGIGISPEQVERLFVPFVQADESTTREFGGSGLGLAICDRLCRMLGGSISVESSPGEGSIFRVSIDGSLAKTAPSELAPAAAPSGDIPTGDNPRLDASSSLPDCSGLAILVAEDGIDNQELIRFILERQGIRVTLVSNGQEALDALEGDGAARFDVVVMDMQMPILDGYETTRALRSRGYDRPILALTAHAMTGDREKCIDAGCSDYTTKPIDRRRLIEAIRTAHSASVATR